MKNSCFLFISVIVSLLSIQTYASDYEVRKLSSFNKLIIEDGITVHLIHSDKNKATVKVDGIDLSEVVTEGSGFSLLIQLKKYESNANVVVELEYTDDIDEITTESGVYVSSNGKLYADDLIIDARFGGNVNIEIDAKELEIQAMGATIAVSGKVKELKVNALKNAIVDCLYLFYSSKDISVSGGAVVKIKE